MRPWPTAVRSFLTSMRSPCFGTGSRDMLIPMPSGMSGRSWAWRCSTATACTRRSRTAVASSSSRAESKSVARLPRSAPAPPDHDHSAPLQVEVVAPEWDATTDGERAGADALVCPPRLCRQTSTSSMAYRNTLQAGRPQAGGEEAAKLPRRRGRAARGRPASARRGQCRTYTSTQIPAEARERLNQTGGPHVEPSRQY